MFIVKSAPNALYCPKLKEPGCPKLKQAGCPRLHHLGPLKSFLAAKWVRNRLQTGPSFLLWALKSLQNGPQRAPPVRYGNTLSYHTRFRIIQTLLGPKKVVNTLGQNKIHLKAIHSKLLNPKMVLTLAIFGLFESFKNLKSSTH